MKKILITGAGGMLGQALVKKFLDAFQEGGESFEIFALDLLEEDSFRQRLPEADERVKYQIADITEPESFRRIFEKISPQLVYNLAAFTDVDGCESSPQRAFLVNAEGVKNVAACCRDAGAVMVQLSTDYIFDGKERRPYREYDRPQPLNVYGRSKLKGEGYLREILKNFFLIRTAWLYGAGGKIL